MAPLDEEVEKSSGRVCAHMNADHADSLLAYARWYAKMDDAKAAKMTNVTTEGFMLDVTLADGSVKPALIKYPSKLQNAAALRKLAVTMHREAYDKLGVRYKLAHGYYSSAARHGWSHLPSQVRWACSGLALFAVANVLAKAAAAYSGRH